MKQLYTGVVITPQDVSYRVQVKAYSAKQASFLFRRQYGFRCRVVDVVAVGQASAPEQLSLF